MILFILKKYKFKIKSYYNIIRKYKNIMNFTKAQYRFQNL